jgi:hypothetical protein
MQRMFKILYSLARNIFSKSNMDYCLADLTSEGGNEYV